MTEFDNLTRLTSTRRHWCSTANNSESLKLIEIGDAARFRWVNYHFIIITSLLHIILYKLSIILFQLRILYCEPFKSENFSISPINSGDALEILIPWKDHWKICVLKRRLFGCLNNWLLQEEEVFHLTNSLVKWKSKNKWLSCGCGCWVNGSQGAIWLFNCYSDHYCHQ